MGGQRDNNKKTAAFEIIRWRGVEDAAKMCPTWLLVTSEIAVASLVPNEQLVKCVFGSFYAVQCEQSGLQLATMRNPAANAGCSLPKPSRRRAAHYHWVRSEV